MNIYEITEQYAIIQNAIENEEITEEEYAVMLECMDFELTEKADGYAYVLRNIELTAEALKKEADRLNAKRKAIEGRAETLKKSLLYALEAMGKDRVKGTAFGFRIGKSKETVITDSKAFFEGLAGTENYNRFVTEKHEAKPNKTAIKKAIGEGEEIAGAAVVENRRLVLVTGG